MFSFNAIFEVLKFQLKTPWNLVVVLVVAQNFVGIFLVRLTSFSRTLQSFETKRKQVCAQTFSKGIKERICQ